MDSDGGGCVGDEGTVEEIAIALPTTLVQREVLHGWGFLGGGEMEQEIHVDQEMGKQMN